MSYLMLFPINVSVRLKDFRRLACVIIINELWEDVWHIIDLGGFIHNCFINVFNFLVTNTSLDAQKLNNTTQNQINAIAVRADSTKLNDAKYNV